MQGRTGHDSAFGGTLDVLIDIVSYGVTPAILLMTYGDFQAVFIVGAFFMIAASALRLSYFVTYGLRGGKHYTGLALDNNSLILVFVLMFEPLFNNTLFTVLLFTVCIAFAALNVSQLKTPKFSGNPVNVYILASYTLFVTAIGTWQLA